MNLLIFLGAIVAFSLLVIAIGIYTAPEMDDKGNVIHEHKNKS